MANYVIVSKEGDDLQFEVETLSSGLFRVTMPDGSAVEVDAYHPAPGRLHMIVGQESLDVDVRLEDTLANVDIASEQHQFEVLNARQQRMRAAGVGSRGAGGPELISPMAGKIIAVNVEVGQSVEEGQLVVIVEAMKMENDLKAHLTGTIADILVSPGQTVEVGDVLVKIEAVE